MNINRCVCYDRTFAELKRLAAKHGCKSVKELQRHVEFGKNCRLCHPYLQRMFETGETVFYFVVEE